MMQRQEAIVEDRGWMGDYVSGVGRSGAARTAAVMSVHIT